MTYSQNVCILFQRQPQPSEVLCLFPFMVPHRQMAGKHSGEGKLKRAAVTIEPGASANSPVLYPSIM